MAVFSFFLGPLAFCNGPTMKCDPLGPTVLPGQPLTVLAEAAHPDESWGNVSFIATSTGDDHAAQSIAQILEQARADSLCTKKRAPPCQ